ncbi:neurofilament heavy polypeptide-like, partial [Amphibalanus amphitrite]|uniref:neurofilament heavy polypeptide-like n=1 Tax=Amphibalanus amphitrite TaxID=1232801 RepID=UPI001C901DB1
MSAERTAQYVLYHQRTSRNVSDALCGSRENEIPLEEQTTSPDGAAAAGSAGLSFGEREPRARRSRPNGERLGRSREELDTRDDQDLRVTASPMARAGPVPDRDAWRENRRLHQSSQILLAFGSSSPRWENSADMGRRCTSSSQLDAAGQRTPIDGKASPSGHAGSSPLPLLLPSAAASASALSAREEPSARRHRSDLTPTAPPGHSFRDPPPARHRSPGKAVSLSRLDVLSRPRRPLASRPDLLHVSPAPAAGRQWQSMWHLGPVAAPRPTRATLLRRAARQSPTHQPGIVAGAPAGSRPPSAQSQQAGPAAAAGGARPSPLRPRSGGRKPRPSSIAGLPTPRHGSEPGTQHTAEGRGSSRSGSSSTPRRPLPASAPTSEARRPAAAAVSSPRRTPAQVKADDARKKKQRSKSSTPQPESRTGLQPTSESGGSEPRSSPAPSSSSAEGSTGHPRGGSTEPPAVTSQPEVTAESEQTEQADGRTTSRKAGYDSEAAARAALAEKRRRVREEAERQAEQERLRREEEERQEQERLRQEELLMEEAARAEQERLQKAIQEAEERRAEEERRREEEERQRQQREQEEEEARREAERARIAAAEKLQREEQERKERRSRVAAIMSRTRAANAAAGGTADKTADSSEEEQTGSGAPQPSEDRSAVQPPASDGQSRDDSSLESHNSDGNPTRAEGTPTAAVDQEQADRAQDSQLDQIDQRSDHFDQRSDHFDQRSDQADQRSDQADQRSDHFDQRSDQADRSLQSEQMSDRNPGLKSDDESDHDVDPQVPMSTDSSPAHTNGNLNTAGINGLDNSAHPDPASDGSGAQQNGGFAALHALVMKPAATSDDEDSINSNVSPRPGTAQEQDPFSLGLTGTGTVSQELPRPVHTSGSRTLIQRVIDYIKNEPAQP